MKIGRGVSELWRVENRPLPLTWPMAYTTACTTVQAVMNLWDVSCIILLTVDKLCGNHFLYVIKVKNGFIECINAIL